MQGTNPEERGYSNQDNQPANIGRSAPPCLPPTTTKNTTRANMPPVPRRHCQESLEERQNTQGCQTLGQMFIPGGSSASTHSIGYRTGLPELGVKDGVERIHVKIDDGVSNKSKQKDRE